jgi:hypothetical protein
MTFLERASLYLGTHPSDPNNPNSTRVPDYTDDALAAMWAHAHTDRLRPIPLGDLQAYLLKQDLDGMLETAATDPALPALLQSGARRIGKMIVSTKLNNLDYQDDEVRGQVLGVLGGMVQAQRMTQAQMDAIKAMGGGDPYTWAAEDGLGDQAAHFAAARTAKARLDAIAANRPAVDAKLQAWEAAEVKKVTDWQAAGFAGDLAAAAAAFAL